ncbi:MAG: hypothetical protein CMN60_21145 [Sphingobium sp.]|nr:hypothetical protein [Sphingobium sp.]MBS50138.1 hypothetical protein [Sphingobium sp.]|tara:strand:- start:253719 stop:254165 length:447 start_codon:yes stop_codon:yes gene_type:complete
MNTKQLRSNLIDALAMVSKIDGVNQSDSIFASAPFRLTLIENLDYTLKWQETIDAIRAYIDLYDAYSHALASRSVLDGSQEAVTRQHHLDLRRSTGMIESLRRQVIRKDLYTLKHNALEQKLAEKFWNLATKIKQTLTEGVKEHINEQ